MTCPKIGNQYDQQISKYLQENIKRELKPYSDDFLPQLKENLQKKIDTIFEEIKLFTSDKPSSYSVEYAITTSLIQVDSVSKFPEAELISKIAKEKFQLTMTTLNFKHNFLLFSNNNFLGKDFLVRISKWFDLTYKVSWSPKNPFFYPKKNKWKRKYQTEPNMAAIKFRKLMINGDLNQTFKICIGKKTYELHQKILASQSDYFKSLVESNMKEARKLSVTLDDCSINTFELFVQFCYYGFVEDTKCLEVLSLLQFADRMQAPNLINYCEDLLNLWIDENPISPGNFETYIKAVNMSDIDCLSQTLFKFTSQKKSEGDESYENKILDSYRDVVKNYLNWLSKQQS